MNSLRPIIDQRLMYFAYYDGEPIGFYLMIPDLNGVIAPLKGRFGAWDKLAAEGKPQSDAHFCTDLRGHSRVPGKRDRIGHDL